jgi:hypothetical protein
MVRQATWRPPGAVARNLTARGRRERYVTIVRVDRVLQRAARVLEATGEPDLSRELRGVRALFHDVAADLRE